MMTAAHALREPDRKISAEPSERNVSVHSGRFAINGRFLTQTLTGVQRYAREITAALDEQLAAEGATIDLLVPSSCTTTPGYRAIAVKAVGPWSGHVWEQTVLPASCRTPLLNLCNLAPAFSRDHVVCIHDANVFTEPAAYSRAFRTYYRALQPWIARRSMGVTTVSRYAATQVARHLDIPASTIRVLPNGHEHALSWNPARSKLVLPNNTDRPYVLLIGSRARHKNAARIVGLAEALDALGLDIVIAGHRGSVFATTHSDEARNVHVLGAVTDDDLAFLLSRALCLVFPSLTEGFGLPVVEAMAWNCPVISSDRASLPEVCGNAALLADPSDDRLWLHHITQLLDSRSLRAELRERGRSRIKHFSWAASARGYLDLFSNAREGRA